MGAQRGRANRACKRAQILLPISRQLALKSFNDLTEYRIRPDVVVLSLKTSPKTVDRSSFSVTPGYRSGLKSALRFAQRLSISWTSLSVRPEE